MLAPWLLAFAADAATQTKDVWFAPSPANGSGSSSGSPRQFDWNYLKTTEIAQLKAFPISDDKILTLHFSAGTHLNVTLSDDFLGTSSPTGLTSWTWIIQGDGARPEETVLKLPDLVSVPSASQDDTGYAEIGMLSFAQNSLGQFQEMKRLVLQNLTLDCNWDGQKPEYTGPQYPRSFKTYAAHLSARTGKVSKVIVRNYGSHGLVPQSVYDNSAGIETFPLTVGTTDAGQEPEPGNPRPWVVEDCEITGFRGVYAGYNTAILAQVRGNKPGAPLQYVTPDVFNDNAARRVVMVRRCQVRGPAGGSGMIGLGSAGVDDSFWSRHITFKDNLLLNVGAGFNTDTGQMQWLDFQNTLFWDVSVLGYLGAIGAASAFESDYNISGNSVRFYGRIAEPVYRDFNAVGRYDSRTAVAPARVLGAPLVNYASGVTIVGAAQYLTLADNWFTARPLSGFYTPDPAAVLSAKFRPVWKVSGSEPYAFDPLNSYFPVRDPAQYVTLGNNKVSGVSFDIGFGPTSLLADGGTFNSFTDTTSPGHTTPLSALATLLNSGFNPTGKVERLVFRTANEVVNYSWLKSTASNPPLPSDTITQPFTEAVSKGADEVVLGVPSVSGNTLTVPVRLAYQPTPGSGTAVTSPQGGQTVWLRTTVGGAAPTSQSALTATGTGVATFNIQLTSGANSLVQFLAWKDAGSTGANNAFDEYQDAWATAQWAQNTTVWVKAGPDVANDQTLARAQFHFYRTGNLTSTPTVAFSLPVTGLKPATYGSAGTGDYTLVANTAKAPSTWAMTGTTGGTLTFAANQAEAVLDVVPRSDTKLENNVVYLTVDPGTGYAVPEVGNTLTPRRATVLIYDGPEYVLFQLDDYTPILAGYPTNTSAYRFANATAAYALDNNATPKIAGGATYLADSYGPNQNFGGWWTTVTPFPLTDFWNDRVGYWQGFGAPSLGVSDDGTFVGQLGNNAFRRTTTGTTFNLAHLSTQNVSAAVGINRGLLTGDATTRYIVGKSRIANVDRPVVWWGGTSLTQPIPYTPSDLGSSPSFFVAQNGAGLATAANDYGTIVGWAELTTVSPKVQRAFRSKDATLVNALPLTLGDELPLPEGTANTVNNLSVAWAVNSATVPAPYVSFAVGSAIKKQIAVLKPAAVFWPNRSTGSTPNPEALILKKIIYGETGTSDATAINDAGFIGGWSKYTIMIANIPTTFTKATLWRGVAVNVLAEDLNDPHIVKLGTGWSLEAVTAINNNRVIVGSGKLNGKTRGFVMVPMPAGN